VAAIALDTTGSSVIPVGEGLEPLDEYYLWCDHRAFAEAEEITAKAHALGFEGIEWCGGVYSHEWGFAKLLHWLRHNPEKRSHFVTALEHCDMVAATLSGITTGRELKRSVCAMGHKWMWNPKWGGLPPEEFLVAVDPLFAGVRAKLGGEYLTSDHLAGHLSQSGLRRWGCAPGFRFPWAHLTRIGMRSARTFREGDAVNVVGTSTCIIAMAREAELVPGVCGVVPGSVHPGYTGIEAGLSATGDIFEAIARRAGTTVAALVRRAGSLQGRADRVAAAELG
jgi:L-ribulokinase